MRGAGAPGIRGSGSLPNESSRGPSRWLHRFAWLLAACTLLLISSGGLVTSKGVGLAVPDWPTSFGYNMFAFPISQWVGGIFFEHVHRLIASTVGFLTIILAVWIWLADSRRWLRMLGLAALGAVILQGVLGGLRVTMMKDEIGIFHALLAQAFLGSLVFIAFATSRRWQVLKGQTPSALVWLPVVTTLCIYFTLGLGATMRHQHRDLSILDFPAAYGRIIPDTSPETLAVVNQWRDARALSDVTAGQIWLQMAHRGMALIIFAGVVGYWFALRKRADAQQSTLRTLSSYWVFFLALQITLGAWTIWSNKAADIATAHVAVGATLLSLGVAISAAAMRLRAAENHPPRVVQPELVPQEARS